LELAKRAETATTAGINAAGETVGGAIGKIRNQLTPDDTKGKPSDDVASTVGTERGRWAASLVNFFLAPFFILFAKRFGAHQCDNCHTRFLYNYYKCTVCADYDLCTSCYDRYAKDKVKGPIQHDASHEFTKHVNGDAMVRTFATGAFIAIAVRLVFKILFF